MTILERYIKADCEIIEENIIENCKKEDFEEKLNDYEWFCKDNTATITKLNNSWFTVNFKDGDWIEVILY